MSKLSLSSDEMLLVNDSSWIISKHKVIKKVYDFFGDLLLRFEEEVKNYWHLFPENIKYLNGKISRGENYRLLPYVILDYPAFFWKENILAIRTMFWWGNFFSITLQLSGNHKDRFTKNRNEIFPWLKKYGYSICTAEGEWEHHFGEDNYKAAIDLDVQEYSEILQKEFFKISKSIPLTEWNNAEIFLTDSFLEILNFLKLSFPGDEKDLSPASPITGSDL